VIALDLLPRRCPVCRRDTIVGHGRRLRHAHDDQHECIWVRRGICEPPYFWHDEMGSLVYAKKCRQQGDRVTAMLSVESVDFYSTVPNSQKYPAGFGLIYPSTGNFIGFVGNTFSRSLVHDALRTFRSVPALPSLGAAVPNAIPGVGWTDHWSFWQQGFPGIEVTDTAPYRNPYYHTAMDTPDRLDYGRLARLTWALRAVIRQLGQ
jgi:hypothetical protein